MSESTTSESYHHALSRVLSRLPRHVSRLLRVEAGLFEYSVSWTELNASSSIQFDISEEFMVISTSSSKLQLLRNQGPAMLTFLARLQEELPYGTIQVKTGEGQVSYRSSESIAGLGDIEEMLYFHLFMHRSLYPLLENCFTQAHSQSFSTNVTGPLLSQLKAGIQSAKLDL